MPSQYSVNLRETKMLENVGAKAKGLHWLMQQGGQVPVAYALPYHVQHLFNGHINEDQALLRRELETIIDSNKAYAVRSAANMEDGQNTSFAGQFSSFLHRRGLEQVIEAVEQIYASLDTNGALSYMAKTGVEREDLKMSVIIQEMITPTLSGVSFSKNPITGLDEIIIEAIGGRDASVVQSGVTPQRWVHKWGKWITAPEDSESDVAVMENIVVETRRLASLFGEPIDLEWIFDGQTVHWIQIRPITRLGQFNIYSNRIAREVLPGTIKPLVWSVNIPTVNGAWTDLFTELIGTNDIDPNSLAKAFYHRAYFNMAVIGRVFSALGIPEETLELLMGLEGGKEKPRFKPGAKTLPHIPRMIRFLVNKLNFTRQVETFLPAIKAEYSGFELEGTAEFDDGKLANQIGHLTDLYRKIAYFNIVTPILAMTYDALVRRQLAKKGIRPEQFDLMHGVEELKDYDPNFHLAQLYQAYQVLDEKSQLQIQNSDYETFINLLGLARFQALVGDFITKFGHLSDSGNDLSSVPWRENKNLILKLVVDSVPKSNNSAKTRWEDLQLGPLERISFGYAYRKARQYRLYREAISSMYTYGYGLFRIYFLEIGQRLKDRNLIDEQEDVFYLFQDEALLALTGDAANTSLKDQVSQRRATIEATRDVILPDIIYGDQPPPVETFDKETDRLIGVPTSRGYYKGRVKVITSVEESDQLKAGDVLVIPYSDVAWTPLFAKAGAVVAEAGGILSHSSIVAREFNLPAVVSVNGACRIPDGQMVTVDAITGQVLLHREE